MTYEETLILDFILSQYTFTESKDRTFVRIALRFDTFEEKVTSLLLNKVCHFESNDTLELERNYKEYINRGIPLEMIKKALSIKATIYNLLLYGTAEAPIGDRVFLSICLEVLYARLSDYRLICNTYVPDNTIKHYIKWFEDKIDWLDIGYIYLFNSNLSSRPLYIGQSKNLKRRLALHKHLPSECYERIKTIEYVKVPKSKLKMYENVLINLYKPEYNVVGKKNSEIYNRDDLVEYLEGLEWVVEDIDKWKK